MGRTPAAVLESFNIADDGLGLSMNEVANFKLGEERTRLSIINYPFSNPIHGGQVPPSFEAEIWTFRAPPCPCCLIKAFKELFTERVEGVKFPGLEFSCEVNQRRAVSLL